MADHDQQAERRRTLGDGVALVFDPADVDDDLCVAAIAVSDLRRPALRPGSTVLVDDGSGHPLPALVLDVVPSGARVRILEPHAALIACLGRLLREPPDHDAGDPAA